MVGIMGNLNTHERRGKLELCVCVLGGVTNNGGIEDHTPYVAQLKNLEITAHCVHCEEVVLGDGKWLMDNKAPMKVDPMGVVGEGVK